MSTAESHQKSFYYHFFFYNSIWFYSKSLGYIVSRYLTSKQCQVWVSSPGVGLLSNPVLFGCFLKFCSTFALTCLEDRNNIVDQRVGGLIWCLHFSFDSMHSTFLTKDSSMQWQRLYVHMSSALMLSELCRCLQQWGFLLVCLSNSLGCVVKRLLGCLFIFQPSRFPK